MDASEGRCACGGRLVGDPIVGPGEPQAALGKGSIDWVKTFQAARTGGVKNYFVEQNMDLTKESVAFLKTFKG